MNELYDLVLYYLNALWKRRWFVLAAAWAVAIPGWLVVAAMPSTYESSSRIYVDTSSVLQPLLRGIAVQADLQMQVQLMKQTLLSGPNLMEVARKTDYDLTVTSDAQREAMLESLRNRTSISSNREDVFSIAFEDTDPRRARDVVQALLTIFVEGNLGQSRRDFDTAENFIDSQIKEYQTRLEQAENALAKFKQDHIDVVMGGEGSYLGRATAATNRMEQLEQDLNVAVAQRNLLSQELQNIPATLPPNFSFTGPPDDTEVRMIELEARLRELKSIYTEKHPDVVAAQRQLEALLAKQEATRAANIEAGPAALTEQLGPPNPVYGEVKLRLIEVETQIEDLRRRAAAARAEAEALASKAEEVPEVEAELQRLNRDYGIVKARHDELLGRRESARMSRSRDAVGQEVQYRVIDPPLVPSQPIGPNRALYLGVVLGFSLVMGVGFAFLLTLLDTSFSSITELRNYTGLPVLGSISDNRKRAAGAYAGTVVLSTGLLALIGVYGALLILERQYGLDTFVTADLNPDLFGKGASMIVKEVSDLVNWIRTSLNS